MNQYDLQVRGETIHIQFKRINDSRRLEGDYYSGPRPNLFKIRGAISCRVVIPISLCPPWCAKDWERSTFSFHGMAFCSNRDQWDSRKGRHVSLGRALGRALDYPSHDDILNAEIVNAFTVEEARRSKAKGPARQPKTAKPKAPRPSLFSVLCELHDLLRELKNPIQTRVLVEDLEKLMDVRPGTLVKVHPVDAKETI